VKSEKVNDRVQDAFKKIIQRLKLTQIPENGLALFAGTFATSNSQSEGLSVEELIPPKPITTFLCEVDNHFQLKPLREMLRDQKVVGLIAIDSKESSLGISNGQRLELLETITSGIPRKSGKGGSSQRRYERERDMELTHFFHRDAEHASKAFLEKNKITVLIVGGPGLTKDDFIKGDFLHYELKNLFLCKVDTQSARKEAVKEMMDKSTEALKNMCLPEEKMIVQRLLTEINKQTGLGIYG